MAVDFEIRNDLEKRSLVGIDGLNERSACIETIQAENPTTISPVRPLDDDAVEPTEEAHQSNLQSELPIEDTEKNITNGDKEKHGDEQTSCFITKEMADEEERLHQKTVEEEEKMRAESERLWNGLDEDGRAQKYEKLKFLLSKSNLYTQYLLRRIEEQKEEDKKRQEKMAKRIAKLKEKQKQEEQKQKESTSSNTEKIQADGKENLNDKESNSDKNSIDESIQNSQSSSGSTTKKRGRKRKTIDTLSEQAEKKKKSEEGFTVSSQSTECLDQESATKVRKDVDFSNKMHFSPEPAGNTEEENSNLSEVGNPKFEKLLQTFITWTTGLNPVVQAMKVRRSSLWYWQRLYCTELHILKTQRKINGEVVDIRQPKIFTGGVLRKYQIEGFEWLKMLYENGINGILADEMGLGKTVQCIAMIGHLVSMGVEGPFLVVAPLSTIPNWYAECIRFTPKVPVVLYHGSKDERIRLRQRIRRKYSVRKDVECHPVVITSYEITMMDRKYIHHYNWKYLIVDEGHRIKNTHCRLITELRMYQTTHRLLLSGTPLQNNLAELWSLLNFLLPEIFDDLGSFEAWFDIQHITESASDRIVEEEQNKQILSMLHQILMPFMLRRVKTDVELIIPPKKEIIVYTNLTAEQEDLYKSLVDKSIFNKFDEKSKEEDKIEVNEKGRTVRWCAKNKVNYQLMIGESGHVEKDEKKKRWTDKDDDELENWCENMIKEESNRKKGKAVVQKISTSQRNVSMKNIMMHLRKCCNHPYLIDYPFDPVTLEYLINEDIVKKCGKMLVLDKMLRELKKRGHKVLLFSQMTKMLDILQDYCYMRGYDYCRLDGSYKIEDRQDQIRKFNTEPQSFIFLVSTRAGGLGINLTAADTVIIYDSDWNPQSDLQAQDRCHRIGQTRAVVVYRFVAASTYDEKIVERAASKRRLEKMVIHKGKFKSGLQNYSTTLQPVTPQELLELLKSNDHNDVVKARDIGEKELEYLLDRSDLYEKMKAQKNKTDNKVKKKKAQKSVDEIKGVFKVIETDNGEDLHSFKNDDQEENNNDKETKRNESEQICDSDNRTDLKENNQESQKSVTIQQVSS